MDQQPQPGLGSSARGALQGIATELAELPVSEVLPPQATWTGYDDQLRDARERSRESEAVVVAEGEVGGVRATLISFDFNFLGGSMGAQAGSLITDAFEHAIAFRQPVISLVATGGARIQEGMSALVQMQRISAALTRARRAGLLHLSVARHPTTGGVWVSLVSSADVIIGLDGAAASFAGNRVRGTFDHADETFSVSGKLRDGFIDAVIPEREAARLVARYIGIVGRSRTGSDPPAVPHQVGPRSAPATGWTAVQRARSPERPRAHEYLNAYFDERVVISGDRRGGRDPGMLCGFGSRAGQTIGYVAQTGSANTPAGFRTATRLLRLANRLKIPVLTLIDTPGAQHDSAAESDGIGNAIGETFLAMAEIKVPVTSVLIGEGGSGGALALAHPDNLWVTSDSYFSVIAPEAAASIVYRNRGRAAEAAEQLHLGPEELVVMGIAAGITPGAER
jgi:acetyl-CoA carboxylase carboxyl transferase subunit beta